MSADADILDGAVSPAENTRLFGHDTAIDFLSKAYRDGHMHHALLLEGPQGIGKATLAFRFARHVLKHPDPQDAPEEITDPDPNDPLARQITGGASHNLLHVTRPIDVKTGRAKTTITVDEVRRAGHFFSQTSGTGNWRIVVIDPADDMNRAAANAILKILEEPPKRSLFLIISHAPGKLLPTIRSRCMPLRLQPLQDDELRHGLSHLGLDTGVEPATLETVINYSDGSLSTAILLLRYGGLDIAEAVERILQDDPLRSRPAIHALADTLTARDRETAYGFFTAYLMDRIMTMAQQDAMQGNLASSDKWARLSAQLNEKLTTARIYNLDRKQTVISLFSSFFRMSAA
ncbi:MAG: DNA polymerase III subunit delta' [Alphaproteobacteria bacterium]|nr:DNA polymerase III subunit delta' [Alphaproteobacteria bacterium]